jgi:cyanophycinase
MSKTLEVQLVDDSLFEGIAGEGFEVLLWNPTGAGIADGQATGNLWENELPPSLSLDATSLTLNENAGAAQFMVALTGSESAVVTSVEYATADGMALAGSDFTLTSGTLVFQPGEREKTFSVPITDDALHEGSMAEYFSVALTNAQNAWIAPYDTAIVHLQDNDPQPTLSINDVTVDEAAGTATFTVGLSAVSGVWASVSYVTADGTATYMGTPSDYGHTSGTLSFSPGETQKTIAVPITGDTVFEPNETFFVRLSDATGATITDDEGLCTITNDDLPPEINLLDESSATIPDGGEVNFGTTTLGVPVTRTFTIQNQGESDLLLDPLSVTLPTGFELVGTFPPTVSPQGSSNFQIRFTAMSPGEHSGELSFANNDANESIYTVALLADANRPPVAVADHYTVTQGGRLTALSRHNQHVLRNDSDPDGDSLTVRLYEEPPANQDHFVLHPDGSFVIEPDDGFVGQIVFEYRAFDGHLISDPATVTIDVVAPSVAAANDLFYLPAYDPATATNPNSRPQLGPIVVDDPPGVMANDRANEAAISVGTTRGQIVDWQGEAGTFRYVPDAEQWLDWDEQFGMWSWRPITDSFVYTVAPDVYATVTISPPKNFRLGNPNDVPGLPYGGLALMGGGDHQNEAVQWLIRQAGQGDFVIVDAYGDSATWVNDVWNVLSGQNSLNSVQIVMATSQADAMNAQNVAAVQNAESILIAGGDQWNYINFWSDTPLETALQAALNDANRAVGGTSAGLAVLGKVDYSARRGAGVESVEALMDPFGKHVTFNRELADTEPVFGETEADRNKDLLVAPQLGGDDGVITDTHFSHRQRGGRLLAFMARTNLKGLAVDDDTAVLVNETNDGTGPAGTARIVGSGFAHFARNVDSAANVVSEGVPLTYKASVRRLGSASDRFTFASGWDLMVGDYDNLLVYEVEAKDGVMTKNWRYAGEM